MGRLTVSLDDVLIDQARKVLGVRTKRDTITAALEEVVRQARLEGIAAHCGKLDLGFSREELLDGRGDA